LVGPRLAKLQMLVRNPIVADGARMWRLAAESKVLDVNSSYAYLLLATHFSSTCAIAEENDGALLGFAGAYRIPQQHDVLFLWQIAVTEAARGRGVALAMLKWLLNQKAAEGVTAFETTVTPSNAPSRALFERFAKDLDATLEIRTGFPQSVFPDDSHEEEQLFHIAPIETGALAK
jgi:L-2,4-diaminobutyric acid acetyltransferase